MMRAVAGSETKEAVYRVDPGTGRNLERLGQSILKKSEDHSEGARAFLEKRKPSFKGR